MSSAVSRVCLVSALLAAILCLSLSIHRGHQAWNAAHTPPGVVVTSGSEEEGLFSIWKVVHHKNLYESAYEIPYASAYFNWLFYRGYGIVTAPFVHNFGDAYILASGRLFTFLGVSLASLALFFFARRLRANEAASTQYAIGAFSILVFMGPLTGWWIHTIRPDIWALTAECLGILYFLLTYRKKRGIAILSAGICFYLAWAFKHSYVQGLGAVVIFLLAERQWRWTFTLLAGISSAWILTILIGGAEYRSWLIEDVGNSQYALDHGLNNLWSAFIKMAPLLIVFGVAIPFGIKNSLSSDTRRLVFYSLPLIFAFAFLTSSKIGAADYYYFTTSLIVALGALTIDLRKITALFWIPACVLSVTFSVILLSRPSPLQIESLQKRWSVWETTEEPRFSEDTRLNLPWLNPDSPPFVLAYHYYSDRNDGLEFEGNGIGGLIAQGYFSSLFLFGKPKDHFDGAALSDYIPITTIEGMTLYRKITDAPQDKSVNEASNFDPGTSK